MSRNKFIGLAAVIAIALIGYSAIKKHADLPETLTDYANKSVKVLALNLQSGGTGSILTSGPAGTQILTNKHVCQLIQVGGVVRTESDVDYPVISFRVYSKHDLCVININKDLNNSIVLAKNEPKLFDGALVSGHPALLPTIITVGHFSHTQIIQIMIDSKACDGTEKGDEALMCMFMGAKPVLKSLEAQATSALIMPGSSGSAVYNSHGELAGVVFAGSQGLSYSFIVPYKYVKDFVTHLSSYPLQTPNAKQKPTSFFNNYLKYKTVCSKHPELTSFCKSSAILGIKYEQAD